jgi:tetratricopeptide (TPR) repeat protein
LNAVEVNTQFFDLRSNSRVSSDEQNDMYSVRAVHNRTLKPVLIFALTSVAASLVSGQDRAALIRQAVSALRDQHPKNAISILEPLIKSQPDDYKALTILGMALSANGKSEEALGVFEHALQVRPLYPPALKGLAASEMTLKQYDPAKKHFEQLLGVAPQDAIANAGLGEIAFIRSNFAEAIQRFERSGSLFRRDPRLVIEYAKANMELSQRAKATDALTNLPDDADALVHFEAGTLLASVKNYDSAARQFELALPTYPDQYSAGFNLVLARVNAKKYREAIEAGQKLLASGHRKAELYNLLAEAYEKAGDTKQAYDSLRTATQLEPSDEANYVDLITLCIEHRNYDLAAEIAGIGLDRRPASERLHLQLGVVLAMKAQLEEARKQFDVAASLAPDRSLPHVALALVSMQMNRPEDAVQQLRKRVRQFPDDYLALWFLGESLNRSGIVPGSPGQQEAVGALERSVRFNPDISQSQELLGKLLARDGRLEEAAMHLKRAVTLDPENAAAIYQLAQVYNRSGNTSKARELFAKVSKMKADDRENFTNRGLQQILRADPTM